MSTAIAYIALTLVRHGNQSILAPALERALKVVDRPGAQDYVDLQGAAALLRDYGTRASIWWYLVENDGPRPKIHAFPFWHELPGLSR
jgi:hypothetical protein